MKHYEFMKDPDKDGNEAISVEHTRKRKHDIGPKIVCLLIAIIIWVYMINMHDTDTTETLTLKIDVVGVDILSAEKDGMAVYAMDKKTVNITVKGTNRDLKKFADTDYRATIDVSQIKNVGEHSIPVVIKTPENSTIALVIAEPSSVSLYSDIETKVIVPLEAVLHGAENQKYAAEISQDYIEVKGPKSVVEKFSRAVAEFSGSLSTGQAYPVSTVRFYDALQNEPDSKFSGSLVYSVADITVTPIERPIEEIPQATESE